MVAGSRHTDLYLVIVNCCDIIYLRKWMNMCVRCVPMCAIGNKLHLLIKSPHSLTIISLFSFLAFLKLKKLIVMVFQKLFKFSFCKNVLLWLNPIKKTKQPYISVCVLFH